MDDSISRRDAINAIIEAGITEYDETLAIEQIECVPAQPEIIRCKDCKHYRPEVGSYEYALGYCPFINSHLVMNKGFCAWAERREE